MREELVFRFSIFLFGLLCGVWMAQVQALGYLAPRLSVDDNAGGASTTSKGLFIT